MLAAFSRLSLFTLIPISNSTLTSFANYNLYFINKLLVANYHVLCVSLAINDLLYLRRLLYFCFSLLLVEIGLLLGGKL